MGRGVGSWVGFTVVLVSALLGCAPHVDRPSVHSGESQNTTFQSSSSRPPYQFSDEDEALLDAVQFGCFNYLWNDVDPVTGMVRDRTGTGFISVAGVGYQLAAIVIADQHGWINHSEAEARARLIVHSLDANPNNRVHGIFFHFLEPGTAGPSGGAYEQVASTVDSAILFAGLLTASSHFGGDIAETADALVADAQWPDFIDPQHERPFEQGFLSLGWKDPQQDDASFRDGLLGYTWADAGDEQRLSAFMALCSPVENHRISPEVYYRLRRTLGDVESEGQVVWFPWSGALFTSFFAHLWIEYAAMEPDDPASAGVPFRTPVDWWENSRRLVQLHRQRAVAEDRPFKGFGVNTWGLSACDGESGYIVPGHFPKLSEHQLGRPKFDYLTLQPTDDWQDGTVAPYAAGSAIMFEPVAAVAALRHYREIATRHPKLWDDPASGGYGFADAFRPTPDGNRAEWIAPDRVAIDVGPLLIAIENARGRTVWEIFGKHRFVQAAEGRLGLHRTRARAKNR